MKKYTKPEVTVAVMKNTDVITLSGGIVTSAFDAKKTGKGYTEITF